MMSKTRPVLLLVEDEPDLRSMWHDYLTRAGWDVHTAASVRDVSALMSAGLEPVLALVDWTLPDGDGASVAEQLRPEVPLVLCSGDRGLLPDAVRTRAAGVLQKPFRLGELARALQDAMSR